MAGRGCVHSRHSAYLETSGPQLYEVRMNPSKPPETVPEQPTRGATPHPHDGRVTVTPARPGKLIRLPVVEDRTGLGKSSVYAKVKDGTFPAPVRLSARAVAWRESDIDRWISERLTTRGCP